MAAVSLSLAVLIAAMSLPACGDDSPAGTDGSVSDGAKDGTASGEQGLGDKGVGDKAVTEGGQGDGTPADGTPGDGTPADQGRTDTGGGGDGGVKRCANDGDCKVFQDCCSCRGVLVSETPPICKKACKRSTCDVWFTQPEAYCVKGRCKVGEGAANTCGNTTKGCQRINDCCRCLAVPASSNVPACTIQSCFVATCTGEGLANTRAQCVNGNCRLSVSP